MRRLRPASSALCAAVLASGCADAPEPPTESVPASAPSAPTVLFIDAAGDVSRMLRWSEGVAAPEVIRDPLPDASRGLALVPGTDRIWWPSREEDVLLRGTLSGTDVERLPLAGLDSAYAVVAAPAGDALYLSDYGRDEILRVDLDGTTADVVVDGLVAPRALDIDAERGVLYWVDRGAGTVQSRPLAGGAIRTLIDAGLPAPYGLVVDPEDGTLLVADAELGSIFRVDPSLETPALDPFLPEAGTHPSFLAIDAPTRTLYWTDNRDNVLRRMSLAGGPVEVLVDGLAGPRGLVLYRPDPNLP